jgi:ribonuclease Z
MTIHFDVLGDAGRDNAVLVSIDSGQNISRLLFDCGENCLSDVSVSEIQDIDHVFFSHFHMDHIAGFDHFFRLTYQRTTRPNLIWGPSDASEIMKHRFQGSHWNLYHDLTSQFDVHDIYPNHIVVTRFFANEAFATAHLLETRSLVNHTIIDTTEYSVQTYQMDHMTPSLAYIVREKPRVNVDTTNLATLGLRPGAWLKQIKTPQQNEPVSLQIEGKTYQLEDLRRQLLVETSGDSLAYLTDFLMDEKTQEQLATVLQNCTVMICECQYLAADRALADRHYHMTATQVAETARCANVQQLVLFHLSDRYNKTEWLELLKEAQTIFPNTTFPSGWMIA